MVLSAALAAVSALSGFWVAWIADASIAGSMAVMAGAVFAAAFLFAPERGVLAQARRRSRQRVDFAQLMLTIHLLNHEDTPAAAEENREDHLGRHLRWAPTFAQRVVRRAEDREWLRRRADGLLTLTPTGREAAREALEG
jgi:manganese/zinc/iron transport system permease protein